MKDNFVWCCGHACVIGIDRDELIFYINKWNNHARFFGVGDFWDYLSYQMGEPVTGFDILWNLKKKVNTASLPIIKEVIKHGSK